MRKHKEKTVSTWVNVALSFLLLLVGTVCLYPESDKVSSSEGGVIYRRGVIGSKSVSLMFNVYQNTEAVQAILQTLKEKNAKATFFVGGSWADDNDETLLQIAQEGHEIGNHGYFHLDHDTLSFARNKEEIVACNRYVEQVLKQKITLFAPPSGAYNQATIDVVVGLKMKMILWTRDTIDWRDHDVSLIYRRATSEITGGEFILMHPTSETAQALSTILEYYKNHGIGMVTVSENLLFGG